MDLNTNPPKFVLIAWTLARIIFPGVDVVSAGKLRVNMSASADVDADVDLAGFRDLEKCITQIVDQYIKRRKLIFLADEVRRAGSLGDRLIHLLGRDRLIITPGLAKSYQGFFIFIVDDRTLLEGGGGDSRGERRTKYVSIMSRINVMNGRSKLLFVWYKTKPNVLKDVEHVFEELWSYQIIDVLAVVLGRYRAIRLYSYFPFTPTHCFEAGSPVLINDWDTRRSRFTNRGRLFSRKTKVYNLYGCKLRCMAIHRPPEAVTERVNNTWRLSGTGVKMFQFVKKYLNFTAEIVVNRPLNIQEREKLNETSCLRSQVAAGVVDMGFGKFIRLLDSEHGVTFAKEIHQDCFTWGVPEGVGYEPSIWRYYESEFSCGSWAMVAVSLITTVIFLKHFSKLVKNELRKFSQTSYLIFFTYATFVGATIKPKPKSLPLRAFVSSWMFYSFVITSVYIAYLGSLVTVPPPEPELQDQKELLTTSLSIGGRQQMFYILNSSAASSFDIEQLILRFQILSPLPFYQHIKRVITRRDMAIFASKRELLYYSEKYRADTNSTTKMIVLPICIVRSYSSPFIFRSGSPFLKPINDVLWRLYETGITMKWDGINKKQESSQEKVFTDETVLTVKHLYGAFVILVGGYIFSAAVFVVEMFSLRGSSYDLSKEITQNVRIVPKNEILPYIN